MFHIPGSLWLNIKTADHPSINKRLELISEVQVQWKKDNNQVTCGKRYFNGKWAETNVDRLASNQTETKKNYHSPLEFKEKPT